MRLYHYPLKTWAILVFTGRSFLATADASAQLCSNPNTLFAIDNAGLLYSVDPTSAATTAAMNTAPYNNAASYTTVVAAQTSAASNANGLGYNSVNGKFYYFKRDPSGGNKQFVSYDPVINKYTTLAVTPITVSVHSACINFNGTGYYCLDVNSNLYYYDILLNTWTFITATFTDQYGNNITTLFQNFSTGDMAIDGFNNIWILPCNATNYALYKMSGPLPTSAVASITLQEITPPTKATPSGVTLYGVAFDASGNIYMSTSTGQLFKLTSAAATPVLMGVMNPTGMTDLTSCSFPLTILPVTWTSFNATMQANGSIALSWNTGTASAGNGFTIEHSTDGNNWQPIGFVQGHLANNNAYSFTDLSPGNTSNYYRIQAFNTDGTVSYSKIAAVTVKNTDRTVIWPNPVTDKINIRTGNNNAWVVIYDAGGNALIKSTLQAGINTIPLPFLPASTYTAQVYLPNGELVSYKIVKQ